LTDIILWKIKAFKWLLSEHDILNIGFL